MKKDRLFSKAWCDLIFEGRNQDYGAYRIRQQAGRRYAFVLILLFGVAVCMTLVMIVYEVVLQRMQTSQVDVQMLSHLERPEAHEGHEFKAIAGGRKRIATALTNEQTGKAPEITHDAKERLVLGTASYHNVIEDGTNFIALPTDTSEREDASQELMQPTLSPTQVIPMMPQFPGGLRALMRWLDQQVLYDDALKRQGLQGHVEISFIVNSKGFVSDIKISQSAHPLLDTVALQAIHRMPRWSPGTYRGVPVPTAITLPIDFILP